MLIGVAAGFAVGILPGLGGTATLAIMLPFTFDMTPTEAFAFLLGMGSVLSTDRYGWYWLLDPLVLGLLLLAVVVVFYPSFRSRRQA